MKTKLEAEPWADSGSGLRASGSGRRKGLTAGGGLTQALCGPQPSHFC